MSRFFLAFVSLMPALGRADPAEAERQVQRALIERDQQAAEVARPELRQMPPTPEATALRPDERVLRAREREAYLPHAAPPAAPPPSTPAPLPLPGGPRHAVDPVPVQGLRG